MLVQIELHGTSGPTGKVSKISSSMQMTALFFFFRGCRVGILLIIVNVSKVYLLRADVKEISSIVCTTVKTCYPSFDQ